MKIALTISLAVLVILLFGAIYFALQWNRKQAPGAGVATPGNTPTPRAWWPLPLGIRVSLLWVLIIVVLWVIFPKAMHNVWTQQQNLCIALGILIIAQFIKGMVPNMEIPSGVVNFLMMTIIAFLVGKAAYGEIKKQNPPPTTITITTPTPILAKPGQLLWETTMTVKGRLYDTKIPPAVGAGVFLKNDGPGKVTVYWAEFDADLEPGQRYAINFVKNRPGATIQWELTSGDSARVSVGS